MAHQMGTRPQDRSGSEKAGRQVDEKREAEKAKQVPGGEATKPTEVPAKGWLQIAKRGFKEAGEDNVPLLAAGLAYYAFVALFPALIACVLLYGLFFDPNEVTRQIQGLTAIPEDIRNLLTSTLAGTAAAQGSTLGWGLVITVALALFSASGGVSNMMKAINLAYDEEPKRSFIKQRAIALLLTLGAILFVVVILALVAVIPAVLNFLPESALTWLIQIGRWVLIAVVISAALAILYRVAPDRDSPKFRWTSVGALVATVLWLVASIGLSIYIANFGNYAKTYGALAGVVILLLWLFITAYAILLGAEINAESEQQTIADTTQGEEQPLGERDAVKADSLPDPSDPAGDKKK